MDCLAQLCKIAPTYIAPGIYFDFPRDVYDNVPALSASVLKKWLIHQSVPGEFSHWLKEERWIEEESDAVLIGRALDCMLLESGRITERFAVLPEDAPRKPTKTQRAAKKPTAAAQAAIEWWAEFNEAAKGKAILTAEQHRSCLKMMEAVESAPAAEGVFEHCRKAVLVGHLFGGIPCKCEIDLWNPKIAHILDLKTARDVRPGAFAWAAREFQYLEQAVFYLGLAAGVPDSESKEVFTFATVRNSVPWSVMFYSFAPMADPDHQVIYTRMCQILEEGAQSLLQHLEAGDFTNNPDWQLIKFPPWQVRQAAFSSDLPFGL
jgi:PDDEXK-like uncharacterized protein DUF3799